MPCRSDGYEPNYQAIADKVTRLLCETMHQIENSDGLTVNFVFSDELKLWWEQHKEFDRQRAEKERLRREEEKKIEEEKKLAKKLRKSLTKEEYNILIKYGNQ